MHYYKIYYNFSKKKQKEAQFNIASEGISFYLKQHIYNCFRNRKATQSTLYTDCFRHFEFNGLISFHYLLIFRSILLFRFLTVLHYSRHFIYSSSSIKPLYSALSLPYKQPHLNNSKLNPPRKLYLIPRSTVSDIPLLILLARTLKHLLFVTTQRYRFNVARHHIAELFLSRCFKVLQITNETGGKPGLFLAVEIHFRIRDLIPHQHLLFPLQQER